MHWILFWSNAQVVLGGFLVAFEHISCNTRYILSGALYASEGCSILIDGFSSFVRNVAVFNGGKGRIETKGL